MAADDDRKRAAGRLASFVLLGGQPYTAADGDMEGATKSRLAEKEEGRKGMLGAVVDKNEGGFCVFWGKGLED